VNWGSYRDKGLPMITGHVFIGATGKDRPGIVAAMSRVLADHSIDIVDLNQRIVGEQFGISIVVDMRLCELTIAQLRQALLRATRSFDIRIHVMHEETIRAMHRV
jgi:ACT domain-containing protein